VGEGFAPGTEDTEKIEGSGAEQARECWERGRREMLGEELEKAGVRGCGRRREGGCAGGLELVEERMGDWGWSGPDREAVEEPQMVMEGRGKRLTQKKRCGPEDREPP
jgi:hypothetical protein